MKPEFHRRIWALIGIAALVPTSLPIYASPPAPINLTKLVYPASIFSNVQINYAGANAANATSWTFSIPGLTKDQADALVQYTAPWLTQNVSNPGPNVYEIPAVPLWVRFNLNWNGFTVTPYCYKLNPMVPPTPTNGWVDVQTYWSNGQWMGGAPAMSADDAAWCLQ